MKDVRLAELWNQVKARILTTEYEAVTGGPGRVFKVTEDYLPTLNDSTKYPENRPWAFTVIMNTRTLWPQADFARRPVTFLCRTECNDFSAPGYDPSVTLERMQSIIYERLHNWVFAATSLVQPAFRLYRNVPPQTMPEWEVDDRRWWLTSEYRTEAAAV